MRLAGPIPSPDMEPAEATVSPPVAPGRPPRRHLRRLLLELVPVGVLVTAALPAVTGESVWEAAGSLGSMVAWCLLPALLILHFLVRSEPGHLVGLLALTGLVVYLLGIGDIEEPLGGLILLQLAIWGPVLAVLVVVGDAIVTWGLARRTSRSPA